jgi:hypothetical protein
MAIQRLTASSIDLPQYPADPWNIFLAHLRENLQSSLLQIPPEMIADLDAIGTRPTGSTSKRSAALRRGTVASG